jgi:tetratricopeptide (TPR) repeat protein
MGRITEALSQVRLALTFDPKNRRYTDKLVELKGRYAEERAAELLGDMRHLERLPKSDLDQAAELIQGLLPQRSGDALLHWTAAEVEIARERYDDAEKLVGIALELEPDSATYHVTRGVIHRKLGEIGHAKREFARALELDPNDDRARELVAAIKSGRPSAKGGSR